MIALPWVGSGQKFYVFNARFWPKSAGNVEWRVAALPDTGRSSGSIYCLLSGCF
jgi:hypothetical protein